MGQTDNSLNPVQLWEVGGMPGEDKHALRRGISLGYERIMEMDVVRLKFPEGDTALFSPHALFPVLGKQEKHAAYAATLEGPKGQIAICSIEEAIDYCMANPGWSWRESYK
jgi:hypothetical protein